MSMSSHQKSVTGSPFLALSVVSLSAQSSHPSSDHTKSAATLVSVDKWTPPNERITPMSLADRIRLGAVAKRGMCSTVAAQSRGNALLTGNGNMTVNVLGDPFAEQLIFGRQHMQRPWKDNKPMEAPKIADVLPEVQRLIMAGDSRKAQEVYLDTAYESNTPPSMRAAR